MLYSTTEANWRRRSTRSLSIFFNQTLAPQLLLETLGDVASPLWESPPLILSWEKWGMDGTLVSLVYWMEVWGSWAAALSTPKEWNGAGSALKLHRTTQTRRLPLLYFLGYPNHSGVDDIKLSLFFGSFELLRQQASCWCLILTRESRLCQDE